MENKLWRASLWLPRAIVGFALLLAGCADLISLQEYEIAPSGTGTGGSGAGGDGGSTGGGLPCETAAECPAPGNECLARTCAKGICDVMDVKAGTPSTMQVGGDCKIRVCNGNGSVIPAHDSGDIEDDSNECTADTCSDSTPMHTPEAVGFPCESIEGHVCDGSDKCVECNFGPDCQTKVCKFNLCQPPACDDSEKNGSETGIDCGGGCGPCPDGAPCLTSVDCESQVCTGLVCAAPVCDDGVQNGFEPDVDCGAACPTRCGPGKGCSGNVDCTGGLCDGTLCLPSCSDLAQNSAETDIDCGGPLCSPCGDGEDCGTPSDCQSGVCMTGNCAPPSCGDGVTNDMEGCDDGNANDTDACLSSCALATCGDGFIRLFSEACDDGNTAGNDGCAATCAVDPGYTCVGSPSVCTPGCGDGTKAGPEACDDGNPASGDGCSATCTIEAGYTCSGATSMCVPICGDGLLRGLETCDDGDTQSGDGCSSACAIEPGYSCSGDPSACSPICGDGMKITNEACDDGNVANGDCCSSGCKIEAGCELEPNNSLPGANSFSAVNVGGNIKGFINPVADNDFFSFAIPAGVIGTVRVETLDGFLPGSSCSSGSVDSFITIFNSVGGSIGTDDDSGEGFCSLATVGNLSTGTYFLEVSAAGGAPFNYTLNVAIGLCANGILEVAEQCDDGNATNGDGCNSACKLEMIPEMEPNNTCATANAPIALTGAISKLVAGAITSAGDGDWFSFTLPATADLRLETFDTSGPGSCTNIDTEIQIFNDDCSTPITPAQNAGGIGLCSKIDPITHSTVRHLTAGTYRVKVNESGNDAVIGGYTLQGTITALCGNNVVEGFEECDGGAMCTPTCDRAQVCSDGFVDAPETCDDGNASSSDGCSPTCATETGYACSAIASGCVAICGDGMLKAPELCDDSNTEVGDGCDSACLPEALLGDVEANDTVAEADLRAMDATPVVISSTSTAVSGSIMPSGDRDIYRLAIISNTIVRIETFEGTGATCIAGMTTTLKLLDAGGAGVVSDPTNAPSNGPSGIGGCAALVLSLSPGTYYVQVEETGNDASIASYRLQVKLMTNKGQETEPNEDQNHSSLLTGSDVVIAGSHLVNTDADFYIVTVPVLMSLRAEITEGGAETCESGGINSRLTLYDFTGAALVDDDDDGRGLCSMINGTGDFAAHDVNAAALSAGTYFLAVRASPAAQSGPAGQFQYGLAVTLRSP